MVAKEADKLLEKWKARLGLSDWDISVEFSTQDHLDGQAKTRIFETSQIAKMFLLPDGDRQDSDPNDSDIEHDIVHELVHVRLWGIGPKDPDKNTHILREQAIEWIARALIKTDRRSKPWSKN